HRGWFWVRRVGGGDAREGGRPLVAAHQDSDSLMVFRIEGATGKLTPVGVCGSFLGREGAAVRGRGGPAPGCGWC
ncbi:MAG: hypothetical protein ACK5UT_07560, partial [Acidobacteriota bacterium]